MVVWSSLEHELACMACWTWIGWGGGEEGEQVHGDPALGLGGWIEKQLRWNSSMQSPCNANSSHHCGYYCWKCNEVGLQSRATRREIQQEGWLKQDITVGRRYSGARTPKNKPTFKSRLATIEFVSV